MAFHEQRTLIMMDGGHTTLVKGVSVGDVDRCIVTAQHGSAPFVYIAAPGDDNPNRLAIDPFKVVALVDVSTAIA